MYKHWNELSKQEFDNFKKGCEDSFRLVFTRYHQTLYRYALSISYDEFEAEDVVQESFILLFQNKHKLDNPSAIYPYLFTLTKRFLIMRFRQKVVETKYSKHLNEDWDEATNITEEVIRKRDLQSLLELYITQLPAKQKEVFQLSRVEDLSYREISSSTGISVHTVKNHLIAASKKIRPKIKKYYLSLLYIFFI